MRARFPRWIIIPALALLACAPGNGGVKRADAPDSPNIIGSWNWTETTGGIAGITKTPESSGETWSIEFKKDGTFREVRNGVEHTGSYGIQIRESIFDHQQRPALLMEGRQIMIIELPGPDRLHLSDNVYDGFNSTFTKTR